MKLDRVRRWLLICAAIVATTFAGDYSYRLWQFSGADYGFERYTDVALPQGVSVVGHAGEIDDNLFHETHNWFLSGSPDAIRTLVRSFQLERSDEEASWALPNMGKLFGVYLNRNDVIEGYEGNACGGRDHWLIMFSEGRGAIFAY
jgi:hypothetical protein